MRDAGRTATENNPDAPCPNRAGSLGRREGDCVRAGAGQAGQKARKLDKGCARPARGRERERPSVVSLGGKYSNQVYSVLRTADGVRRWVVWKCYSRTPDRAGICCLSLYVCPAQINDGFEGGTWEVLSRFGAAV